MMGTKSMGTKSQRFFSRSMLLQMFIAFVVLATVFWWQRELLANIYIRNQPTSLSWVINGAILFLFGIGMLRMIRLFVFYGHEETATNRFEHNLIQDIEPTHNVPLGSLISRRYNTLLEMRTKRSTINHNALAATQVATEASKLSFPRFVNNVLILTGVFGTIVSLSIALTGASSLLGDSSQSAGITLVVHGMSTALSTTMTAIFSFMIFSYFFLRLTDAQTNLISHIEHITATQLISRFEIQKDSAIGEFTHLMHTAILLLQRMEQVEETSQQSAQDLKHVLIQFSKQIQINNDRSEEIVYLLKKGFRLE